MPRKNVALLSVPLVLPVMTQVMFVFTWKTVPHTGRCVPGL